MIRKKGRPPLPDKEVIAIEKDTGEAISFKNYRDAADAIGANRGNVYLCLEGIRKSHMGYVFQYRND